MRFERGIDPKETLKLGIPSYRIYRMQVFRVMDHEHGFYILSPLEIKEALEKISMGKLSRLNYIIEFAASYDDFENKVEMNLYEMPTCFLVYQTKQYFIKSHIHAIRKR